MMYTEIDNKTLKKLQTVQIEILDEIIRICDKYGLNYFLIGGTLLGAVRHQGFIPWDDDLDIGMLRKDYNKFLEVAPKELGEKYFLHTDTTDSKYWLPFSKVRKNNTLFLEKTLDGIDVIHRGIFVDIFPFDNMHAKESKSERVRASLLKIIAEALLYKKKIYTLNKCHHKYLVYCFHFLSYKRLHSLKKYLMSLNHDDNSSYINTFATRAIYPDDNHLRSDFFPLVEMKFADKLYKCPNNYDKYLKQLYGDYMKLPKEEDRINHQTLEIVFDTQKK